MIANCITAGRILFSSLLLVFSPRSPLFAVFYLLCGVSDVLDGFAARKMHTQSEKGAMLDSAADLFFAFVYAVKILPLLSIPLWIWIWTFSVAAAKTAIIVKESRRARGLRVRHSFGNRLTGLLLFLLPLSVCAADVKYAAAVVCITATVTVVKEMTNQKEELPL